MNVKELIEGMTARLTGLARANAVVGKTVSVGDRHIIPLCELAVGLGGGGGEGEVAGETGKGAGGGGGARAVPVAVIVVEGGRARVETLER